MDEKTLLNSFKCPCCGMRSYNRYDIEQGYCGACHWWTGDQGLGPGHLADPCEARDRASTITVRSIRDSRATRAADSPMTARTTVQPKEK